MKLLLRAFPAGFRQRYGDEMLDLVQARRTPVRDGVDILLAAARLRGDRAVSWLLRRATPGARVHGVLIVAAAMTAIQTDCATVALGSLGAAGLVAASRWRTALTIAR